MREYRGYNLAFVQDGVLVRCSITGEVVETAPNWSQAEKDIDSWHNAR